MDLAALLPSILPGAIAWAEREAALVLSNGAPSRNTALQTQGLSACKPPSSSGSPSSRACRRRTIRL